ncbi:MAG: hypothetical protein ACSLFI_01865 [Solirubrobacterales bacterium]
MSPAPGSEGFFARIQARVSSWQLPVRIPVPNRDNLIAMGLMALAFGLMVGVAIGPALGPSSNADATVVAPAPAAVPETPATDETVTEVADTPALGAPAGSDLPDSTGDPGSTTLASTGDDGFTTPTDIPDSPDPVYPDDDYVAPDTTPRAPDETPAGVTGTPLKATVVGVGRSETSYAVVDEFGNLLGLHGKKTPPLASRISNRIEPLANGSFGETVGWTARGEKTEAPLRGVVSYLDPDAGWIVVSSRGASVAVDASELLAAGDLKAELGSQVEGEVGFLFDLEDDPDGGPLLEAISLEAVGDPGTILEINGRLVAADAEAGLITMAPDGGGRIKEKVEIVTPEDFDPATVVAGGTHNATVEVGESGELLLTGLSSDLNAKVADDVTTAFGDHRQD